MDMHATVSGRSWMSTCVPGLPCWLCRLGAASEVPPSCPSIKVGLPDWADPALLQPRQRPSGLGAWRRRHEDVHLRNTWGCRSLILIRACAVGLGRKLSPCKAFAWPPSEESANPSACAGCATLHRVAPLYSLSVLPSGWKKHLAFMHSP